MSKLACSGDLKAFGRFQIETIGYWGFNSIKKYGDLFSSLVFVYYVPLYVLLKNRLDCTKTTENNGLFSSDFLSQKFDWEFVGVNVPSSLFVRIVDLFSFQSQTQEVRLWRVFVQKWGMEPEKNIHWISFFSLILESYVGNTKVFKSKGRIILFVVFV